MSPEQTGVDPKEWMPCCRWCDSSPLWVVRKAREGQLTSSQSRSSNSLSKFFSRVRLSKAAAVATLEAAPLALGAPAQ